MSKNQSATTTRREFLGAATVVTAATLASPAIVEGQELNDPQEKLPEIQVAQASTETASPATRRGDGLVKTAGNGDSEGRIL